MISLRVLPSLLGNAATTRSFRQCAVLQKFKDYDHRTWMKSMPKKDEGVQGVGSVEISGHHQTSFPDESTFTTLQINGVPFTELPIIHVKCSLNNTICTLTDANGKYIYIRSGGTEGYKNTRKGTTIAAQAAATSLAHRAISYSLTDVRVVIKGLGPGRLASIKGLQMTGMNIVSITDRTPASEYPPRPRKAKRL
ncbi:30S ribosomal protein S11-like [Tropilaelaps mercedesae]|uniref:30S ribosomal protein S11-like n=1 Tax=Tropilaelaps mercedesae TaxID=418985 RepID=A0A1V9Y1T5_9ACAR|nr:30S ribosomal protein S11-like [Tropilaelaps mercedesae]